MTVANGICEIRSPDGELACTRKVSHIGNHRHDPTGDEWTPRGHWFPKKWCDCWFCIKGANGVS